MGLHVEHCQETIEKWVREGRSTLSLIPTLYIKDLKARGWTDTLVKNFLGREHERDAVDHWANFQGKRAWWLPMIHAAEAEEDFQREFERSAKRRRLSSEQIAAMLSARAETLPILELWRSSLANTTDEHLREHFGIQQVASVFRDLRRMGYRTPHKA